MTTQAEILTLVNAVEKLIIITDNRFFNNEEDKQKVDLSLSNCLAMLAKITGNALEDIG